MCGSKYAVDDPTFLCDRCLRDTHYEDEEISLDDNKDTVQTEGAFHSKYKKLFDFKAYHYSQL